MDWITILLVFLFFVLPLIQEVAKKRQPQEPVEPHDYGDEEEWEAEEVEEIEAAAEGTGGRSSQEEANAWESLGLEGIFTGKTPSPPAPERVPPAHRPSPPPAPAPAPVPQPPPRPERPPPVVRSEEEDPALERLRAYERKVRDVARRPVPEAAPVPGFTRTARSARMAEEISTLGEVQHRGSTRARRLRRLLDDPEAFEDAFVLREILGPPRGIEPHD
jgi:hypothetical protein